MKEYSLEAIIWEDHTSAHRTNLPKKPDDFVTTVLSVGLVTQETDKVVVLTFEIERYDERDDVTFIAILKHAIISRKVYGTIKIKKPRK